MQLTNAREAAAFVLARGIIVAILFVATPTVLSPFYLQLMRTSGPAAMSAATFGVAIVMWLVTLVLFLAFRGGFGGVPASVAGPDRRGAVVSSGGEIGAYLVTLVLVMVMSSVLNIFMVTRIYTSLRQSGQANLIVPVSLAVALVTALLFLLIFVALRAAMSGAAAGADSITAYDEGGASMGFGQAIATCFRKYAVFSGRASRSEYWFWVLFQFLLILGLTTVDVLTFRTTNVLSGIASLVLFLPSLGVTVRRLHDIDRSGWWVLIYFVPLIGLIVMLVFLCTRGTDGANRFGMGPAGAAIPEVFA